VPQKRAYPWLWAAFLLAAASADFSTAQNVSRAREAAAPRPKSNDPFLSGAPFSFDQLQRLIAEDAIPLRRRKDAIQARGLSFSPSSEQLEKLKAAGASEEVLKLIKNSPRFSVASVPVAPPTGALIVTCAPADCEIALNGTALGATQNGTLKALGLSPGTWTIDFKKAGYVGSQTTARIELDKTTPVSSVLEPDRKTQESMGAEVFRKMIGAIGGDEGIKTLTSVQAVGSTTFATGENSSLRWTLAMRNKQDRALFQVRAGDGFLHEVAFAGTEYKVSKRLKGQDVQDLPTTFGLIRDYQLAAMIRRLQNSQFKMIAKHDVPSAGEEFALVAESGTETISIGLDDNLRPQSIRITTPTGVGSANVTYSDYFQQDKVSYPKTVQIKPEGWRQGIDVRFDKVEFSTKLSDNDYKLKGKPFVNF
jgi:hypothetical protein